jgi:hypothetical protein
MLVSGYEHQTWECSGCSGIEQRMTFTRKTRQTRRAPVEPVSVEAPQTATDELTQIEAAETAPVVSIQPPSLISIQVEQTAPAELSQTAPVETTVSVKAIGKPEPPQAIPPQVPAAALQTSVLPKTIDERLRYLTNRVTAFREAAAQDKRRVQFNRDWDHLPSVRSPLGSSGALRQKDHSEPERSPTVSVTTPASNDMPTSPERARGWKWRRLLSLRRQRSSAG